MKSSTFFSTMRIKSMCFMALVMVSAMSFAQNPYTIQFQDETIEMPENIGTFQWADMPEKSQLANGFVGWVQFYNTPTQDVQDLFAANRLELINYISNHAYLFYFPANTSVALLADNGVRSIVPVDNRVKLSSALKTGAIGDWAISGDNFLVTLQHHDKVSTDYVIAQLAAEQIGVVERYSNSNNIDLTIPNNCLDALSNLSFVKWVEVVVAPSIPDDLRGRSLHRASALDTQTTAGRNYDGTGIGVMCRDDGAVGPHIDFQGRIFGIVGNNGSNTHGDGVSGIMAGAGNRDPKNRGMAAGADLHVVNYNASFLDTATNNLIASGDVQITNSSYSNGCNAGYTTITETVDQQSIDTPELLHVFSAGNSNNLDCGYGAGNQWGNITGGHKQGKNVIATANVFFDGELVSSSSRGPAHDGRIKPDISANGQNQISTAPNNGYLTFGGTSGAAPGIAGISAQLYQAYMEANGGSMPDGALIKAALLNTANEAGNVGPDFKFGWGIVNGLRAGILIEDGRHLDDAISQGGSNTHNITVPAGTAQLRVMLYWNDPAANVGATTALVNDLDLEVTDPGSTTFQPWILDSTPNATALDTPATNGVDRLNNVEQVLINNPTAGTYDIDISGFNVPEGPQDYYVVWEVIEENLTLTYPNGGEKLRANNPYVIHWDAINTTQDFVLEYSDDDGASWSNIATVDNDETLFTWSFPATFTGEGLVRITSGAFSDVSDVNFSVANFPTVMNVTKVCEGEATFTWTAVADAESYDVYLLGEKYMEVVANVTTETATVPVVEGGGGNYNFWYAIAAKNDTEGWESPRRIASNYDGGTLDCVLGVNDNALANSITMYPNPADNKVFIDFGTTTVSDVTIAVTNSLGQTIQTLSNRDVNSTQTAINVSNFGTGIYFVTITADGSQTTKKLVVK
ncbi:S8 family serine peptidase [Rasiella rasia]|uniref:S8 family serine peptidase n=1 Tax=Rasiella rasia TaxID=2744027 RepID=A0A6G6GMZ4_9FLAO|nr:S8 family serine peptidase [Rasiella rasia]QIE59955.1 S8 family serine peptidase [Rasiella rasia]